MGRDASLTATPGDGAIIAASLSDPRLFSTVFDRHFAAIHRYLARRSDRHTADDLASLTFVVALERRETFHGHEQNARPWLYGIATNLLRNHRRDERRKLSVEVVQGRHCAVMNGAQPHASGAMDGLARVESSEERAVVGLALAGLDPDQRDVLLLYAWGELSYEEIAQSLGIPLGTVRSRLSRARAQLKATLPRFATPTDDFAATATEQEDR